MAVDRAESVRRGRGRSKGTAYFASESRAGAQIRSSLSGALAAFADEVREKALRSAVYAGAKVLSTELELRTRAMAGTGELADAVYHYHDDKKSRGGRQVYAVGVNKVKAPHWFVVEYGHYRYNVVFRGPNGELIPTKARLPAPVWVPAMPYLRPTWDTKGAEAVRAMQRRLVERIRELRAEAMATNGADA